MCIAIVKTKGGTITDEQLKNCFNRNKDGAGFAYPKDGEVVIEKGFFKFDDFLKRYRKVEKKCNSNMLIHFRISTAGLIDKMNCHPHRINDKLVMIHNGILHIDVPKNSKVSDTVLYCKRYLKQLPKGFTHNDVIMEFMAEHIGSYNKFCFLDSNGDYKIVNEDAGKWVDGVWYSNDSYKAPAYVNFGRYNKYWSEHACGGLDASYYDRWYDEDDYYDKTNEVYGYGNVCKTSKTAWLTPAEQDEILRSNDFYDDVWNSIDKLADDLYNDNDYNPLLNLGTEPRVMLLTGELVNSKFSSLVHQIKLSELDKELYDTYMIYYNEAEEMALKELNTTEASNDRK